MKLRSFSMLNSLGTWLGYILYGAVLFVIVLFAGTLLPFVDYGLRIVESGSMAPAIPMGSVIMIAPAENYTVDDVITFRRLEDEELTTHRIVEERLEAGQEVFVTQGDANNVPDMESVEAQEVLGKVRLHIPYLGFIFDFFRQPLGFLILVFIPGVLVLREQVQKIKGELGKGTTKGQDKE